MAGVPKPKPLEAFEANMRDARHLVALADGLTNTRARRMRKELRQKVGEAWQVPVRKRDQLDCLESDDMFLTFKPDSRLNREDFTDRRPLLRQALVAACAATETYLADRVMQEVSNLTKSPDAATARLRDLSMTIGDWLEIEHRYERRRTGLHRLIEHHVRELASTSSTRVGQLLSMAGVANAKARLDHHRGVAKGETYALLDRVTERRNKIVHTADRMGRSRAELTADEARTMLDGLESVVQAIEKSLNDHARTLPATRASKRGS